MNTFFDHMILVLIIAAIIGFALIIFSFIFSKLGLDKKLAEWFFTDDENEDEE